MKFQTVSNYDFRRQFYEDSDKPSLTVPDQTMSIQELLDRYAKGLPLDGQKVPIYRGDDDDMPDLTHMDLADRERAIDEAADELRMLNERADRKKKKAAEKAASKKVEKPTSDDGSEDKSAEKAGGKSPEA